MKRILIQDLLNEPALFQKFSLEMANGAVAVIPTDTLYGFAVAANNPNAVARVYEIKNREAIKPLILFVHSKQELLNMGYSISPELVQILDTHWPGALTAILPRIIEPQTLAFSFNKIGIRIPNHELLLRLLKRLPIKLLTTSANRSGTESEASPEKIIAEFENEIDWFVDAGELPKAIPSTVADFTTMPYKVLRQGKIAL